MYKKYMKPCLNADKSGPWSSVVILSPEMKELGRMTFKNVLTPATFHGAWVKN